MVKLKLKGLNKDLTPRVILEGKPLKEAEEYNLIKAKENNFIRWGKFGASVLIEELTDEILKNYKFVTIYGNRGEIVYYYDKNTGLWGNNGRAKIKTLVETYTRNYARIKSVNEIFEKIKRQTEISLEDFNDTPEELILVNNGVLDVKAHKLLSFNPNYYFKSKLDIKYNEKADCPKIKKFLGETFYEEDIPIIQEWLGFHLYKRYFIKKSVILFGAKNTGKTAFINLLIKFIGEKNKTGISLHSISKGDKFTLSFLKDKLANIYDDLSFEDLKDAGGFKIACGGGFVTAEYKFGDTFQFLNYAKNTFATNKIPEIKGETDDAYYLRWLPIACDNEISENEQDKFLLDKLTTPQELSGLLNYSLEGLKRLLENGKFSYNRSVEETKALMEKHSNHLSAFVQDCLIESTNNKITKDEMFELYTIYANDNNLQRLSKTQLGRSLERFCKFIRAVRENERYWIGADIRDYIIKSTRNKTLKTFLQNLRGNRLQNDNNKDIIKGIDMVFENASYVSTKDNIYYDNKKKEKIDWCEFEK